MPNEKASPQHSRPSGEGKTQIIRRVQGAQENALRSLQDVNEEVVYRSATQQSRARCAFLPGGKYPIHRNNTVDVEII